MGAYYPDEGNRNTEFSHNVASALNNGRPAVANGNAWWLFLWKNTIRNCPVFSNFAENGTGCWNAVRRPSISTRCRTTADALFVLLLLTMLFCSL